MATPSPELRQPEPRDFSAADLERALDAERRRIAREIHDRLGPVLTALNFDMVHFRKGLAAKAPPEALLAEVDAISGFIALALESVRSLATDLRPPLLDQAGLAAALEAYAAGFTRRTGIETRFDRPAEEPALPGHVSSAIFMICQELLTNVARHSGARSVRLRLASSGSALSLEVRDDGCGFRGPCPPSSLGLHGVRERVALLGGDLDLDPGPGRGVAITVRIPLHAHPAR